MVDFLKTVKSDPKTLDLHLISCEYTVKNRLNWSGINLCAGKKRALVDVSTPPAAKMCKGSLGMSSFFIGQCLSPNQVNYHFVSLFVQKH